MIGRIAHLRIAALSLLLLAASTVSAQVLPEDRFDVLYHSYEGDNVEITGPSILFRKKVTNSFSGYANFYIDSISSASGLIAKSGRRFKLRSLVFLGIWVDWPPRSLRLTTMWWIE